MTTEEYEQKKRKCWEEFLQKHEIRTADGVTAVAFIMAFDRAYALGKQEKDAEGEEMLTCDRDVVRMLYDGTDSVKVRQVLEGIFGSKCLPDEDAHEDNFATKKPQPAEPKNKDSELLHPESVENLRIPGEKSHSRDNSPETADSDNHLADVGKMMDRRLNIAAMAMQGILSNADRMKGYEYVATTPPCEELTVVVARNALRYADALIAEAQRTDKLNK